MSFDLATGSYTDTDAFNAMVAEANAERPYDLRMEDAAREDEAKAALYPSQRDHYLKQARFCRAQAAHCRAGFVGTAYAALEAEEAAAARVAA